jgi:hypothetical protein
MKWRWPSLPTMAVATGTLRTGALHRRVGGVEDRAPLRVTAA